MRSWAGLLGAPVGGAVGLLGVPVGRVAWCARGRRPAREIATREPDGSEWSISMPGQAPPPPTAAAARPFGSAAYGRRSQALRFRRRLRPPQPGPVSKPGQAPPAATLNISAYNLRQHFLFYPQCAK